MQIKKYLPYTLLLSILTPYIHIVKLHAEKSGLYVSAAASINAPGSRMFSSSYSPLILTHDVGDGVYRPLTGSLMALFNFNSIEELNAFFALIGEPAPTDVVLSGEQSDKESGFIIGSSFSPQVALGYKLGRFTAEVSYDYSSYSFFNYRYNLIATNILEGLNTVFQSESQNNNVWLSASFQQPIDDSVPLEIIMGLGLGINFAKETTKFNVSGTRYNVKNVSNNQYFSIVPTWVLLMI